MVHPEKHHPIAAGQSSHLPHLAQVRIIGAELLAPDEQRDWNVLTTYVPAPRLRRALLRAGALELAAVPFELRATPRALLARLAGALTLPGLATYAHA